MGGTHEENAAGSRTSGWRTCWNLHLLRC